MADDLPAPDAELEDTHHDEDPDDGARDDLTNGDLARIFHEIGDILEVQGEIAFKTIAYHRAADAIGRSPIDLVAAYRSGHPPKIPGVGKAISDKIAELVTTGHMAYYERLRAEIPPSLVDLRPAVGTIANMGLQGGNPEAHLVIEEEVDLVWK